MKSKVYINQWRIMFNNILMDQKKTYKNGNIDGVLKSNQILTFIDVPSTINDLEKYLKDLSLDLIKTFGVRLIKKQRLVFSLIIKDETRKLNIPNVSIAVMGSNEEGISEDKGFIWNNRFPYQIPVNILEKQR